MLDFIYGDRMSSPQGSPEDALEPTQNRQTAGQKKTVKVVERYEDEDEEEENWKLRRRTSSKGKVLGALQRELNDSDLDLDYEQDRLEVEQKIKQFEVDARHNIQFEGGDKSSCNESISCDAGGTPNTRTAA